MKTMRNILPLVCLLAAACGGGGGGGATEGPVPEARLSDIQAKLLTPGCAAFSSCHSTTGNAGHCDLTPGHTFYALVGRSSPDVPGRLLVVPGHPEQSFLIKKLRGELAPDEGYPMPFRNPPLSEAQIQAIEDWISAGALDD